MKAHLGLRWLERSLRPRRVALFYGLVGLVALVAWRFSVSHAEAPARVLAGAGAVHTSGFSGSLLATTQRWAMAPGEALKVEIELPSAANLRGVAFGYRAEGLPLKGVQARLIRRSAGTEVVLEGLRLDGNTPGFFREVMAAGQEASSTDGDAVLLEFELAAPVRTAWFELSPLTRLESDFAFEVSRGGWLVALWQRPLVYAGLVIPALAATLLGLWSLGLPARLFGLVLVLVAFAPLHHFSPAGAKDGMLAGVAAQVAVGLMTAVRFAWFLQPTQAIAEHLPPVGWISPEWMRSLSVHPAFQGNATASGVQAHLETIESSLRRGFELTPAPWLQALSLLLPLAVLVWAFRLWARPFTLSARGLVPALVLISGMMLWVVHPSWKLPIATPLGHFLGHLLLLMVGVQALAAGLAVASEPLRPVPAADRLPPVDLRIGLALAAAAVLIHLPQLSLAATVESDETNGGYQAAQVAELFGLSVLAFGRVAWGGVIGLVVLALVAWRRPSLGRRLVHAGVLVAALAILGYGWMQLVREREFAWSELGLFRYPPGVRIVEGIVASMGNGSYEWSRFTCSVFAAISGAILYWAARIMAVRRAAALGGAAVYFAAQLVFYWSSFGYYTGIFFLGHALLFLCWALWRRAAPGGQGWLLAGIWIATLLYFIHQSGIAALLAFLPVACLAVVMTSPLNWRDVLALAAGTLAVAPWIQLWQDGIIGSWFGWVGRTISWNALLSRLADNHAWSLPGWTLVNANGVLWILLGLAGLAVGLASARHRLLAILCVTLFLGHGVLQILVGRMSEYDGYGRFVVILALPVTCLIMILFDTAEARWPRGRYVVPLLVLGVLIARGSYHFEAQPLVMPPDRATNTQWNGNGHGFFPEARVLAAVPGARAAEIGVLVPWNIVGSWSKGIGPHGLTSLALLKERLAQNGCRYLVTIEPKDEATYFRYFNVVYRWPPDVFDRKMIEEPRTYFADWPLVAEIDYWNYRILVWNPESN